MHIHPDIVIFALVLVVILGLTFRVVRARMKNFPIDRRWMETIRYLGQISLALGVVLQAIELTNALDSLELAGGTVTMDKVAGGLKSTMYATIHGLLVYIIAMAIFLVLRLTDKKDSLQHPDT